MNLSAYPLCIDITHIQMQVIKRPISANLLKSQFLHGKFVHAQFAFGIDPPHKFAGMFTQCLRRAAEQRRQHALQPPRTSTRTDPAIQLGRIELIGVQLESPLRASIQIRDRILRDRARPVRPESIHI